ncbi:hypothetical protein [Enterococcus lactis]|uniref:hypothetical protein n=1 Tax=Enterococcus lactis TaxID=357441 RepID=UPI0040420A93
MKLIKAKKITKKIIIELPQNCTKINNAISFIPYNNVVGKREEIKGKLEDNYLIFVVKKTIKVDKKDFAFNELVYSFEEIKKGEKYFFKKKSIRNIIIHYLKKWKKTSIIALSLTIGSFGITLVKNDISIFNHPKISMSVFGNAHIDENNYTKIIDESSRWKVTAKKNSSIEIGCLTCRGLMSKDGVVYFSLPKVLKVELKNGVVIKEVNLYSFTKNESVILDLDSDIKNVNGDRKKSFLDETNSKVEILASLTKSPKSTFYSKKEYLDDKISIDNIENNTFYVSYQQEYSNTLFDKNKAVLEPKIGVNLLEIKDTKDRSNYFIIFSKYSSRYSVDKSNVNINKRGNIDYEVLKVSDFVSDPYSFENFVFKQDSLTEYIKKEIELLPETHLDGIDSAVPYYKIGQNYVREKYNELVNIINSIYNRR